MKKFSTWLEARSPKGAPTSLNIWTMFDSLEKGGGVISDRVPASDISHLRRCLQAGFLERGPDGFVPTPEGVKAMEGELALRISRDPSYRRPAWMGAEDAAINSPRRDPSENF